VADSANLKLPLNGTRKSLEVASNMVDPLEFGEEKEA
jgi:hypothetical protein